MLQCTLYVRYVLVTVKKKKNRSGSLGESENGALGHAETDVRSE